MKKLVKTIDGNEAVAYSAYRMNEVIIIYPITPSSPMGESCDQWSSESKPNVWGTVPQVVEMQSEAGAAGAIHGAIQTGSLATTFTSSQGLLLMIPNMYKIAGELTPVVFNVAARSLAAQALSIFCDHGDVMATRGTGFALLSSASVQEAMDFAVIAQSATLKTRIPFLHFFDGFRTSHEVSKIELLQEDVIRSMIDDNNIREYRDRALTPDKPVLRGTSQNPDVFFQHRERINEFYSACPKTVQDVMDQFAKATGRSYKIYEYHGAPDAERVVVIMGSGAEAVHETVDFLNSKNQKVGVLKVRLYRPFDGKAFVDAFPKTTKSIAVLDRTKEPGSEGDPLYLDCFRAFYEYLKDGSNKIRKVPAIVGGRYGLGSKEFSAAMVKGVFDELSKPEPKNFFTVGINDDVTKTSIDYDPEFSAEGDECRRAVFYGLGSDGTVGANKNSIKIIGENTPNYAQGYFVYDSKKAGAVTISHLRFGPKPIRSNYLVSHANFVACHQTVFLEKYDMLKGIVPGGTFLLNAPFGVDKAFEELPKKVQDDIISKKLKFYVIDAYKVAKETGMGSRINTIMQVCFFAISGVLPKDQAIEAIKNSIRTTYGKKGEEVVNQNLKAVDGTLDNLHEIKVPQKAAGTKEVLPPVSDNAPDFVKKVLGPMIAARGDELPVSAFPVDGTYPTATTQWEKRNIALEIPVWDPAVCIQCAKCSFVCPHGVIRTKVYDAKDLEGAPEGFKSMDVRAGEWKGKKFTIQVAPEDCTGCGACVETCPAKNRAKPGFKAINMSPQPPLRESERKNWEFFLNKLPDMDRSKVPVDKIRQQQVQRPLFEFSSACAGCGETPYIKLMSQLFGDRVLAANATGCSSIYGGNLPMTPWAVNCDGRGPAWSNSLFEDNAEFGLGMRLSVDKQKEYAEELLKKLSGKIGDELVSKILSQNQKTESEINEQRLRVQELKNKLKNLKSDEAFRLMQVADMLVKKSVWIIGGDGWAYDIGFGGLDHVLASGRNVNILVLDTEVYSNTGGQMSKSTPRGAIAKFAASGKPAPKKDLGLIAMTYGNAYVASVAMGAKDEHTLKAFVEAEAYDGPSIIIAYSHCIAHGINMRTAYQNQKAAVQSGHWILYRYNPDLKAQGKNPLILEPVAKRIPLNEYMMMENRYKMLKKSKPEMAKKLFEEAQADVERRNKYYAQLASMGADPTTVPEKKIAVA